MPAVLSAAQAETVPVFQVDLNDIFGPVVIGVLLACGLYGVSCVQTLVYFLANPMDTIWVKTVVITNLLLCGVNVVALASVVYQDLVLHFGNVTILATLSWGSRAEALLTPLIVFLIQGFFLFRIFRFTSSRVLVIVSAPFILVTLGLGLSTAGRVFRNPSATSDPTEQRVLHANDIFLAVTDLLLAAIMAYSLHQNRPTSEARAASTEKVITTLIAYAIATGALTGAVALIGFILAVADPTSTANQAMYAILPHMYSNAMLASLNLRQIATKPWRSGEAMELTGFRAPPSLSHSESTRVANISQSSKVLQVSLNESETRVSDATKIY